MLMICKIIVRKKIIQNHRITNKYLLYTYRRAEF